MQRPYLHILDIDQQFPKGINPEIRMTSCLKIGKTNTGELCFGLFALYSPLTLAQEQKTNFFEFVSQLDSHQFTDIGTRVDAAQYLADTIYPAFVPLVAFHVSFKLRMQVAQQQT